MGSLQIDVLGTSFSIKATEDDKYLENLLGYYTKITDEIQSSGMLKNNLQISILAGIMICDELYKEKSKKTSENITVQDEADSNEFEKRTLSMIKKLEEALNK